MGTLLSGVDGNHIGRVYWRIRDVWEIDHSHFFLSLSFVLYFVLFPS